MLCYLFAAFVSIGLFTYFSALTPYVLQVNLGLPQSEHGRVSGNLQFWQEIVLLATIGWWGAMSDRIGRRTVYVAGFVVFAAGYALYAFATSVGELLVYRLVLGFGIAATAAMLSTIIADYPDESSRGKLTGIAFFLNGVGSVIFFLGLTKLPLVFERGGADQLWSGRYAYHGRGRHRAAGRRGHAGAQARATRRRRGAHAAHASSWPKASRPRAARGLPCATRGRSRPGRTWRSSRSSSPCGSSSRDHRRECRRRRRPPTPA